MGSDIQWVDLGDEVGVDPQDGGEPILYWWEDMRRREVRQLVQEAYERGRAHPAVARRLALAEKLARTVESAHLVCGCGDCAGCRALAALAAYREEVPRE